MTIIINSNSYVTEAEATEYFSEKYGFDKWTAETNKVGALISAAQQLDCLCDWYGIPCVTTQPMAFPRSPDCPLTVPQEIKDAQCEIAYKIVDTGSVSTVAGAPLSELKAGSLQLKFKAGVKGNPLINDLTIRLLLDYGFCFGGSGTTTIIPIDRS